MTTSRQSRQLREIEEWASLLLENGDTEWDVDEKAWINDVHETLGALVERRAGPTVGPAPGGEG